MPACMSRTYAGDSLQSAGLDKFEGKHRLISAILNVIVIEIINLPSRLTAEIAFAVLTTQASKI